MACTPAGSLRSTNLRQHHADHAADFGTPSESQYLKLADEFCGGPKSGSVLECVRKSGDLVRYSTQTEEFGVVSSQGFIRTYFKSVSAAHGFAGNLDYFNYNCER